MKPWLAKLSLASVLGILCLSLQAADDEKKTPDEKKPSSSTPSKAPNWSKFSTYGDATGIVSEADEDGFVLKIPGRAIVSRRSAPKDVSVEHSLKYAEGALVRWKKLPPKLNAEGKKTNYTPSELEKLRQPTGVPGYAAEKSDLVAGKIVEVQLVRPKSIPAAKVTPEDILIKYAFIIGETTPPSKKADKDKE